MPIYRWEISDDYFEYKSLVSSPFWWFQNAMGKIIAEIATPSLKTAIFKSYELKSLYDLTRISAELHLKYSPEKSPEDNLSELETYMTIDPCSGKPYIWDQDKKILYGIGTDRDDKGHYKQGDFEKVDSCILH